MIVFVRGREVTYVYGARDFLVVYWENLLEGICPICENGLAGRYCVNCEFDWKNASADEAVEHFGDA